MLSPHSPPLPEVAQAWQRAALQTLWRLGVPAQAGAVRRSAAAVTLELVPIHPETMPLAMRAGAALQAAMGIPRTVTVRQAGRLALVDVPLPKSLTRVRSLDRLPQARGLALPIGWGPDGRAVWLDLGSPSTPHGAILGATGSGKSNAVGLLLWQLLSGGAPGLRVVLADPDGRTFPGMRCAIDSADIGAALRWVGDEVERRAAGPQVPEPGPVVVFVDEAQDVLRNSANKQALELVTARGRKHRVHAVLSGRAVPRSVGENLRWRLAGGTVDYHASMGAVGMVGAERLPLGAMILQPGAVRLAVPEVDLAALQALAGSPAIVQPWAVPGPVPQASPPVPEGIPADAWGWLAGCAQDGGRLPGIGAIARRYRVGKARAAEWRAAAGRRDGWSSGGDLVNLAEHTLPHLVTVPEVAS